MLSGKDYALGLIDLLYHSICRLLTGAILAHELMHAWLRLKGKLILSFYLRGSAIDFRDV